MKLLTYISLAAYAAFALGCSPVATPNPPNQPNNAQANNASNTTDGGDQAVDYSAQISTALKIEDAAARVQALGEIAVAAAKDKDQAATVQALEEIEKVGLKGGGGPDEYTPLEKWTRDAAMAIARSSKDPNVGVRIVQQFASSDPLKFKKLSDDVMLEWTKVPGDVRDTINKRIPGLN